MSSYMHSTCFEMFVLVISQVEYIIYEDRRRPKVQIMRKSRQKTIFVILPPNFIIFIPNFAISGPLKSYNWNNSCSYGFVIPKSGVSNQLYGFYALYCYFQTMIGGFTGIQHHFALTRASLVNFTQKLRKLKKKICFGLLSPQKHLRVHISEVRMDELSHN